MTGILKTIEWCGYQLGKQLGHLIALPLDRVMRTEVGEIPLVVEEEDIVRFAIQCFGGPKDGHAEILERDSRPALVYVWEVYDDQRMDKVEGPAREALRARVGTLAYRFDHMHAREGYPNDREFIYVYDPKRNKRHAEKTANAPKK